MRATTPRPGQDHTDLAERPTGAEHQMARGRVRAYAPRGEHTARIAKATREILADLGANDIKPTVRQLFYLLVDRKLVEKTAKGYEKLKEQTGRMRKGGYIAMDALIDGTRERLDWRFYERPSEALLDAAESFERNPWADQPTVCELWMEAGTHKEMLRPVAEELSVSMICTHGSSSISQLDIAAKAINARWQYEGKATKIIYVGDHDPAGIDMSSKLHERLCEVHMIPEASVVERVAVTVEQIKNPRRPLPTRPAKKGDTRTPWYEEMFPGLGCVELDAIPPEELITIVRRAILDAIEDQRPWVQSEISTKQTKARVIALLEQHKGAIDRDMGYEDDEDEE